MRLQGGRTGKRAVVCENLELTGLMKPFDLEVWYGERVAVLGSNGSGKSHFLRLLAIGGSDPDVEHRPVGDVEIKPVPHTGKAKLGARVRPGWFVQTHEHPELVGPDPAGDPAPRRRVAQRPLGHGSRAGRPGARPLRAGARRRAEVRVAQRRPAGAVPDPAARAVRRHPAAARRADRQPRRAVRRGARGRPRGVRRHRARGHPRPLVRPRLRPVPRVRRGRRGLRVRRPGVGRGPGGSGPDERPGDRRPSTRTTGRRSTPWHDVYLAAPAAGPGRRRSPWQLEEMRASMQDPAARSRAARLVRLGRPGRRRRLAAAPLLDNPDRPRSPCTRPDRAPAAGTPPRCSPTSSRTPASAAAPCWSAESPGRTTAAPGGAAARAEFARAAGVRPRARRREAVLALPVAARLLDELAAEAAPHHDGYTLRSFVGPVPDDLVDGWARLTSSLMTEAPTGDLDVEPETADPGGSARREALIARARAARSTTPWRSTRRASWSPTPTSRRRCHEPGKAYQWGTLVRARRPRAPARPGGQGRQPAAAPGERPDIDRADDVQRRGQRAHDRRQRAARLRAGRPARRVPEALYAKGPTGVQETGLLAGGAQSPPRGRGGACGTRDQEVDASASESSVSVTVLVSPSWR